MKISLTLFGATFALALTVILLTTAPAQAAPTFDELLQQGLSAYKSRQYETAAERFRAAYRLNPDPTLIYNVARCHELRGQTEKAIANYDLFVDLPGTSAAARAKAHAKIAALQRAPKARVASVEALDASPAPSTPRPTEASKPPLEPTPTPKVVDVPSGAAQLLVVAHPQVPIARLSSKDIRALFLGKARKWKGGVAVRLIDQVTESESRKKFMSKVMDMSAASYDRSWVQLRFSKGVSLPKRYKSDEAVLGLVASTPGAIGFILSTSLPAAWSGKVLLSIDEGVK